MGEMSLRHGPAGQDRADRPHPAPRRAHVGLAALWFGIFGGPLAWSVQTLVNLSVASHGCFPRLEPLASPVNGNLRGIVFVVSLFAILVCVGAATVALHSWSRTRGGYQSAAGAGRAHDPRAALMETGEGRTRFMALCGVLTSVTFLGAILMHTASIFLVYPCGR